MRGTGGGGSTTPSAGGSKSFWISLFLGLATVPAHDLLQPSRVESLLHARPQNLELLVRKLIQYLQMLCRIGSRTHLTHPEEDSLLSCISLFSRILSICIVEPSVEAALFWRPIPQTAFAEELQRLQIQRQPYELQDAQQQDKQQQDAEEPQEHLQEQPQEQDSEQQGEEQHRQQQQQDSPKADKESQSPTPFEGATRCTTLANELMNTLARLLFLNGFSVNAPRAFLAEGEEPTTHIVDSRFLWCGGIGSEPASPCPTLSCMFTNRTQILRCAACVQTIDDYLRQEPSWLAVFTAGHAPYTANLFCSLLSSVVTYDPVGYVRFGRYLSPYLHMHAAVVIGAPLVALAAAATSLDGFSLDCETNPNSRLLLRACCAS
ncbi:uncharacterized protein LOC34620297 [Cyclospora cayetanensis]|uniref:Uncharacterized protein LOC34620297 n=1 Tax=Cyclospora cayetanensis TaxID=88456 RepID=A0A6P6S2F9_9EIME|nr:uncharacterized protein LOC34620297 [Cyclospora cayetanensis]